MLNRREALAGAILALGVMGFGEEALAQLPAPAPPAAAWTPKAVSPDEARLLMVVTEAIMPTTDTPGAIAAGVPQYIDRLMVDWLEPPTVQLLRAGLARMDADALAAHRARFVALTPAQQLALLTRYEIEASDGLKMRPVPAHFFRSLKELTLIGYFTSEPGATLALRYAATPGEFRPCVPLAEIGRAWAL